MPKITTAGKHTGKVTTAEFGEAKTGTPFLYLGLANTAGEHIGAWLYLSEAAFEGSLKTLRNAFNFDGNFDTLLAQVTFKDCSFECQFEEFDGKETLKVKWINGPRSTKPIADQGSFLKNLTAKAARVPVEAAKPRAAAPVKVASQVKEPDPF